MYSFAGGQRIWIHSVRGDLIWFQGSVMAGIALLTFFLWVSHSNGTHATATDPMLIGVFVWGVLFDGTHVWATYARTYFAPDDDSRAGLPGSWSWALLAVGPAIALIAAATQIPIVFQLFVLIAYLWAYWHLVRQHYGFLMLYRKRAGETNVRGARLDELMLWIGCLYPFLRFSLTDAYVRSGLPQLVPASIVTSTRLALDVAFGIATIILVATVLSQRIEKLRLGPKHLLIAVVVGFHLLVFAALDNLLAILATLTIFHNIQYHRIVWMYERGLGRTPCGGLLPYLAIGLALGVSWYGLRVLGVAELGPGLVRNLVIGFCWGIAFHHYFVDGRIWHVRRSTAVSQALGARSQ